MNSRKIIFKQKLEKKLSNNQWGKPLMLRWTVSVLVSLFFSIVAVSRFFAEGNKFGTVVFAILIIAMINTIVIYILMRGHISLTIWLVSLFGGRKLRNMGVILKSWLPAAILCSVSALIITGISGYYIEKQFSVPLGSSAEAIYLNLVKDIVSYTMLPLIILFILLGLILQVFVLRHKERIKTILAFSSSAISFAIFAVVFWIIQRLIMGFWGFL
jgi:hypothetical protein